MFICRPTVAISLLRRGIVRTARCLALSEMSTVVIGLWWAQEQHEQAEVPAFEREGFDSGAIMLC